MPARGLIFLVLFFSFHQVFGQFRTYSNEFLNIGAGARGLSMGGAHIAGVSNSESGYWNPAALSSVREAPTVSLMHAEYFGGIGKFEFGGLALPINNQKTTLGISFLRFGIDDIPNTLFLVEPDGSINTNNIESFSSADYALLLSLGHLLKEKGNSRFQVGGNIKVIHRGIGKFAKAWGFGLDLAAHYKTGNFSLAAVLRDASTTWNTWKFNFTDREKEILYLTNNTIPVQSTELTAPRLILGTRYDWAISEKITASPELQFDLTFDGKRNTVLRSDVISVDPKAGLEIDYNKAFFIRGGIGNFQQALKDGDTTNMKKTWIFQPSVGAGFQIKGLTIDYAFTNLANQSSPLFTHIVSLGLKFTQKEK